MSDRPYVLLSAAVSLDGYLDDASDDRLLLSNDEDFDRVDEVRAGVDAILVGANTVRVDNPRLAVRSAERRQGRVDKGLPESPVKVTLSRNGELDPAARFFTEGNGDKLVYVPSGAVAAVTGRLGGRAVVVDGGEPFDLAGVLADLAGRGVRRLLVEGGGAVHTLFLTEDLVDEVHLVIAPFFVGDAAAPRFVQPGRFVNGPGRPLTLAETRRMGDVVLLRYLTGARA
nr:dihydrofolate reductase family protein [Amycolatopsis anabasis]